MKNSKLKSKPGSKSTARATRAVSAAPASLNTSTPAFWYVKHLNDHTNEQLAANSSNEFVGEKECDDGTYPLWKCPQFVIENLAGSDKHSSGMSYHVYIQVGHDGAIHRYSGDVWQLIATIKDKQKAQLGENAQRHPFSAEKAPLPFFVEALYKGHDWHRGPHPRAV